MDLEARQARDRFQRFQIEGVRDGDVQRALVFADGQHHVLAREGTREGTGDEARIELERVELLVRHLGIARENLSDAVFVELLAGAAGEVPAEGRDDLRGRDLVALLVAALAAGFGGQDAAALRRLLDLHRAFLISREEALPRQQVEQQLGRQRGRSQSNPRERMVAALNT